MSGINSVMAEFCWTMTFGKSFREVEKMINQGKEKDVAKLCIRKAYLDFNRTLRFDKNGNEKERENRRHEYHKETSGIVLEGCKELFGATSETKYDDTHKKACEKLVENGQQSEFLVNFSEKWPHKFCYGQAQKWINMSMKYMYLMGYWNNKNDDFEKFMHVPVDGYVLKATAKNCELVQQVKVYGIHGYDCGKASLVPEPYKEGKSQPWSHWNQSDYIDFIKQLREAVRGSVFEWEAEIWPQMTSDSKKN